MGASSASGVKARIGAGLVALGSLAALATVGMAQTTEHDGIASRQGEVGGSVEQAAPESQLRLEQRGMTAGSPVMVRIFKAESELELWLKRGDRFELFATYPICFWSGTLGPKLREGDRQAPEGLYAVGLQQLHRDGRRPRSFDIGYPNSLDHAEGHTGSNIWVHGGCGSTGCFAMTNPVMDEIFTLAELALAGGQDRFQVHVFPFRMTEENMAMHADSPWHPFWRNLQEAYDAFERTRTPPQVAVCGTRYVVAEGAVVAPSVIEEPPPPDTAAVACDESEVRPLAMLGPELTPPAARAARHHRAQHHLHKRHIAGRRNRQTSAKLGQRSHRGRA
jgi:murein L,D-transpeptidase YafK